MAFNINICISGPKPIVHNETIAEMLMKQLENNNDLFGMDCTTGKQYGYPKLKKDVLAIATAFQKDNDFGRGDVVMVAGFGSYEGQVVLLAGLLIGATVASLDYNLKRETLASLISESKPDVIFCSEPESVTVISDTLKTIAHRPALKISTTTSRDDGFAAYSNLVDTDHLFVRPVKSAVNNKYHPCAIIYSSGTTGVPKGIYLSDYALKSALISVKFMMDEPIENKCMTTSPMFWYTGVLLLMFGVHFGKPRLFFSVKPSTEQILSSIHRFKPTFLLTGVAAVNEMMCFQMTNGHKYDIDSLVTFAVGGSPMRPELQKTITENLLRGRIPIKQAYGASEQGIVANWTMKSDTNTVVHGCVGRPAAGIEIRIVSLETGECVGPNTEGEIRVKSASNMIGYLNDMKKTVNSYDEDGWFKSGDIGYYTDDCCLFIVGRIKELMIYKGKRIAPTDVETVLLSHSAVLDAGVTSRDGLYGDLLIGVVKAKPGVNVEADQLVSYVKNNVKDHEQLRGGLIFVDDVPRSPAGKLKREELKRLVK